MRPRFRITTLLWITALVAAFFVGRRSDEVVSGFDRWWHVTRVRLGGDVRRNRRVVMWPRRSATINEDFAIQNVSTDNPQICTAMRVSDRQLRITPAADGETTVRYSVPGGQKPYRFHLAVKDGRIADWSLEGPVRRNVSGN